MQVKDLEHKSEHVASLLKMLASPVRLQILCLLIRGEHSVSALAEATGLRVANISQHLTTLKSAQVVSFRRDGQTLYYRLEHGVVEDIMQVLAKHYC